MSSKVTVLLIHGIFSSEETWKPLVDLIHQDGELADLVNLQLFSYSTKLIEPRPTRRVPDINTVARSLATFIDASVPESEPMVIVAHSQGGLIVQRFLVQQLDEGRGERLQRIRSVVFLATPNSGSELLLSLRRRILPRNAQERDLRPLSEEIVDTQRRVLRDVVFATEVSPGTSPIPLYAYAGQSDNIVVPASALSLFPKHGVVPGDHSTISKPSSTAAPVYRVIKARILEALSKPAPNLDLPLDTPADDATTLRVFQVPPLSQEVMQQIAAALLAVEDFRNATTRRQFVELMPPYIREKVELGSNARLDVFALVAACARFERIGRDALLTSLEWAFPPEDPSAGRMVALVRTYWPEETSD